MEKMSDYYKYQWDYKKKNYYNLVITLRKDADADLIHSLKNFDGNRIEWIKRVIRNALVNEGRFKKAPEEDKADYPNKF